MTSPSPWAPSERPAPRWCRSRPTSAPDCWWPRSATPTATTSGCGSNQPTPRSAEVPPRLTPTPGDAEADRRKPARPMARSVDGDRKLLAGRVLGLGLGLRLGVHHTDREGERPGE